MSLKYKQLLVLVSIPVIGILLYYFTVRSMFLDDKKSFVLSSTMSKATLISSWIKESKINPEDSTRNNINKKILKEFGKVGIETTYLVDREGKVILGSSDLRTGIPKTFTNDLNFKKAMKQGFYVGEFETDGDGGGIVFVSYAKINKNFTVLVMQHKDDSYIFLSTLNFKTLLFILIIIAISIITGFLLINRPIKAITEVDKALLEVEKGNLDIEVEETNTKDEIGLMVNSFNQMVKGVQKIINKAVRISSPLPNDEREVSTISKKPLLIKEKETPKVEIPEVKIPEVKIPEVKIPEVKIPEVKIPEVKIPEVKIPEVEIPEVKIPEVKIPEVEIPEVKIPEVEIPEEVSVELKEKEIIITDNEQVIDLPPEPDIINEIQDSGGSFASLELDRENELEKKYEESEDQLPTKKLENIPLNKNSSNIPKPKVSLKPSGLPASTLLSYYNQIALDLARELNKNINPLKIVGGEININGESNKRIFSTLLHAVRFFIFHGLEDPEDRITNGKPPNGSIGIKVLFKQVDKKTKALEIVVKDDGKGVSAKGIRSMMERMGFYDIVKNESDEDVIQHVFDNGFSTKSCILDSNGKKVGLNAIRITAQELGGDAKILSVAGKGSLIVVRIPYV